MAKIKQICLENFMAFSNAVVDFDESGILNLKGYSDSGKSAVMLGLFVCFDNIKPSKQVNWIKDGCKYFRIGVTFEDGVQIIRYKYSNGQSMYEMFKGGSLVYTSKVNNQLTPINDVPEVISNYINLAKLESGVLNFRTNQDKQFLAQTTGRENFQDLNSLFGIDDILNAINYCKAEISQYSSEMQMNKVEMDFHRERLEKSKDVREELLGGILKQDELLKMLISKSEDKSALLSHISVLKRAKVLPEISPVSSSIDKIEEIGGLIEGLVGAELKPISKVADDSLKSLISVKESISSLISMKPLPVCGGVSFDRAACLFEIEGLLGGFGAVAPVLDGLGGVCIPLLSDISDLTASLVGIESEISEAEKVVAGLLGGLEKLKAALKAKGYSLVECKNCGSFSVEVLE